MQLNPWGKTKDRAINKKQRMGKMQAMVKRNVALSAKTGGI